MFGAYSSVLLTDRIRMRLVAMFLSAVPLGMLSLTIVLCVQGWTGTLRAAGSISALFGMGNAIGLSIQGPLIDRFGSRPIVMATGGVCTVSLLGFGLLGSLAAPLWTLAASAALSGVTVPAITTAVRAWLSHALPEASHRGTAYALISALFQSAVTLGPVMVSLALVLHGPVLAVGFAALMVLAATAVHALSGSERPARRGTSRALGGTASQGPGAVWRSRGLRTLLGAAGLSGLATGMTAVAVPGVMTGAGVVVLAGVAFTALALGEVLGALVFGSRTWPGQGRVQLPLVQAAVVLAAVLVFFSAHQPWLLVIAMFGAGLIGAPVSVLTSALLDDVAPEAALARAYSLLVAVGLVTGAAGNALAGHLVEHTGVEGLLLLPVLALALAVAWTVARRGTLQTGTRS